MKQRVLVTGGTRGLGLALSRQLVEAGFQVIATGRQPSSALDELASRPASQNGGKVVFEPLDLAAIDHLHQRVTAIVKAHGPLYGLVNNAAIAHDGVLATMHESQIIDINVNVIGTLVLTKYALRPMLLAGEGRIVNVSSVVASSGFNGLSVYAASKSALIGFTRSLARELGKARITVNAVLPGFLETEMSAGLGDAQRATIVRRSPLGQLATLNDVAGAVKYLLSPQASTITGTSITVDAGGSC